LTNTIENCFDFLEYQKNPDYVITKDTLISYAGLDNEYSINILKEQLKILEIEAGHSFSNVQLIPLLNWANKDKGFHFDRLKLVVKTLSFIATADEISAQLEEIE
jgi:hypothetical protein